MVKTPVNPDVLRWARESANLTIDDSKVKINSGYQNKNGITLGKIIISNYKIRYENVEKYKLFNDRL